MPENATNPHTENTISRAERTSSPMDTVIAKQNRDMEHLQFYPPLGKCYMTTKCTVCTWLPKASPETKRSSKKLEKGKLRNTALELPRKNNGNCVENLWLVVGESLFLFQEKFGPLKGWRNEDSAVWWNTNSHCYKTWGPRMTQA